MYLLTSINQEMCGYEIVIANGTKKECESELANMQYKVWHNADDSLKAFSDIYDSTRSVNAEIVTNKEAARLYGGRKKLEHTVEFFYYEM